jgi:hypothetical protein
MIRLRLSSFVVALSLAILPACCFCPPAAVGVPSADIDAAALAAGCAGVGCSLVSEVAGAAPFGPCPTTQSVWLGEIVPVGGQSARAVPYFVQIRPTAFGGCEASGRVLVTESAAEEEDVARVLAALRAGQPLPPSPAVDYVRSAAPPSGFHPLSCDERASRARSKANTSTCVARGLRLLLLEDGGGAGVQYPQAGIAASLVVGELWPIP